MVKKSIVLKVMVPMVVIGMLASCNSKSKNSESFANNDSVSTKNAVAGQIAEETLDYGINLGLSVNWAECNVGADNSEDIGVRVPLGNVTGTVKAPSARNENVSGTNADIAVVMMGDGWRMPTGVEMQELLSSCNWTVETVNGHKGFRVTGKNGNSIFLPNTGSNYQSEELSGMNYKFSDNTNLRYEGNYWCGTPAKDNVGCNHLHFDTDKSKASLMWCELYFCCAVRAVHEK